MRTTTLAFVAAVLVGLAQFAHAQTVVTYYPAGVPVTTYFAPSVPTTTYYAPPAAVTTYPAPVTTYYAPAAPVTAYYAPVGRPTYIVRPKVYVRGQPIRNVLRAITP